MTYIEVSYFSLDDKLHTYSAQGDGFYVDERTGTLHITKKNEIHTVALFNNWNHARKINNND